MGLKGDSSTRKNRKPRERIWEVGDDEDMRIDVRVGNFDVLVEKVDELIGEVRSLSRTLRRSTKVDQKADEHMALEMERLQAEVQENTDATSAVTAVVSRLSEELRNAAGDPAAVNALADQLDANNAALVAAALANTQADPEAPVEEAPPVEEPPA